MFFFHLAIINMDFIEGVMLATDLFLRLPKRSRHLRGIPQIRDTDFGRALSHIEDRLIADSESLMGFPGDMLYGFWQVRIPLPERRYYEWDR